jgi:hypothetical protein
MKARTSTALLVLAEVAVLANIGYSCWRVANLFWTGGDSAPQEGPVMEFFRHSDPEFHETLAVFGDPIVRAILWLFLSLLVGGLVTEGIAVRLFRGTRWLSEPHEERETDTRRVIITPPPKDEP